MADTAYANPDQLAVAEKLPTADFSQVQTLQPGQTPTGQYYLNAGNPTVYNNANFDPNAASNAALAKSAGLAGVNVADFQKLLGAGSTPDRAAIEQGLGIPALQQQAFAPPDKSTEQLYNDAYAAAGLGDIKSKLTALDATISDKKAKLTQQLGVVNETPWLSEAGRLGDSKNLQNLAAGDINNAIDEQKQYQDLYNQGLNEVNGVVSRHTTDYQTNQQLANAHLSVLQKQAEDQITAAQSANEAKLARYIPDYLAGAATSKAPNTVTAGNGATYQWDANSGKFIQLSGPKPVAGPKTPSPKAPGPTNPSNVPAGPAIAPIVNPATDAAVKSIIASHPGDGGYGDAFNAVKAKFGDAVAQKYDKQYQAIFNSGQSVDQVFGSSTSTKVPSIVTPYLNTSSSGVNYVDASTLQGTPTQKTAIIQAATAAGLKVITNKNTSADLVNISDANAKLNSVGQIIGSLTQPSAMARNLHNLGLTQFETFAQTDPQKAAAGALQSIGLDILKAISGIQGFRGNASVVKQVTDHLPSIYDSTPVAQQKIEYIRQLISDRENSILGTSQSNNSSTGSGDYQSYLKAIGQ